MSKGPETAELQELLNGLTALLNEASPVAMVIVAGALVEDQVLRTVEKVMPGLKETDHKLRVDILTAMGVISNHARAALNALGSIRNKFAHEPHNYTFESQNVVAFSQNLEKALRSESEADWKTFDAFHGVIDAKSRAAGGSARWHHPVAKRIISGFLYLSFYVTWARHFAPLPQSPFKLAQISEFLGKAATGEA